MTTVAPLIGTPIDEVIEQFAEAESHYGYHNFNRVAVNDDTITFSMFDRPVHEAKVDADYWLKYFCDTAKIPFDYIKTLDRDMLVELVNYHHPKIQPEQYTKRNTVVIGEDRKKNDFGIVSSLRQFVKGSTLLRTYKGFFEGQTNVVHAHVDIAKPRFSILNEKWDTSFIGDFDTQYFGLTMGWNSEYKTPRVYASSHRPHCGNLMHVPDNIGMVSGRFKQLSNTIVLERFMTGGRKAVRHVNEVLIPQLQMSTTKTFSDLIGYLNTLPMSEDTRNLIIKAFLNEQGNTVYLVIQACTYAATHFNLEQPQIDALNSVISYLLDQQTTHTCKKCHQEIH